MPLGLWASRTARTARGTGAGPTQPREPGERGGGSTASRAQRRTIFSRTIFRGTQLYANGSRDEMHVISGNPSVAAHGSRGTANVFGLLACARAATLWYHARYQPGEVVALVRRCRRAAATLAYTRKARDSADTYGLVRPRAGSGVRVVEQGEATAPCHSAQWPRAAARVRGPRRPSGCARTWSTWSAVGSLTPR